MDAVINLPADEQYKFKVHPEPLHITELLLAAQLRFYISPDTRQGEVLSRLFPKDH